MKDQVTIVETPLKRWIIQLKKDETLAWSGSRWSKHVDGVGVTFQICNFANIVEAAQFALNQGFKVVDIEQSFL